MRLYSHACSVERCREALGQVNACDVESATAIVGDGEFLVHVVACLAKVVRSIGSHFFFLALLVELELRFVRYRSVCAYDIRLLAHVLHQADGFGVFKFGIIAGV